MEHTRNVSNYTILYFIILDYYYTILYSRGLIAHIAVLGLIAHIAVPRGTAMWAMSPRTAMWAMSPRAYSIAIVYIVYSKV